jgi:hypothetical protein
MTMPGRVSRDTPLTILVGLDTEGEITLVMRDLFSPGGCQVYSPLVNAK